MQEIDAKRRAGWWSRLVGTEAEVEAVRSEAEELFRSQQREIARLEEALALASQLRAADEEKARARELELQSMTQAASRNATLRSQAEAALQESQQRLASVEAMYKRLRDESFSERQHFDELRAGWERARAELSAEAAALRDGAQETARKAEAQRLAHLRDMEAVRAAGIRDRTRFTEVANEQRASLASADAKLLALQEELAAAQRGAEAAREEVAALKVELTRARQVADERAAVIVRHEKAASVGAAELERLRAAHGEVQKSAAAAQLAARGHLAQIELLSGSVAAEQERAGAAQRRLNEAQARASQLAEQVRGKQAELDAMRASVDALTLARDAARRQSAAVRKGGATLFRVSLRALQMTVGERAGLPLRAAFAAEAARAATSPEGADGLLRALGDAGFDPSLVSAPPAESAEAIRAWWASVLAGDADAGAAEG